MGTHTHARHLALIDGRSGRRWALCARHLTLGRGGGCDIQLQGDAVAPRHALIEQQPSGDYVLLDYGAAAGTRVNGEKIRRRALSVGDVIRIAGTTLLVAVAADRGMADTHVKEPPDDDGRGIAQDESVAIEAAAAAAEEAPPLDGTPCVMVRVCWGEQLLRSAQVRRRSRYVIGEETAADLPLSAELLGVRRLELVNRRGEVTLVEAGITSAPRQLLPGEQVSMRCGQLTISARCVLAPRPIRPSRWRLLSRGPVPLMLGALLTVAALPQAMAQWPRAPRAEEPSVSQYAFMRARLPEAEEPPPSPEEEPEPPPQLAVRGEQGMAPTAASTMAPPETAIERDMQPPQRAVLPRADETSEEWASLEDASQFGLIALLGQAGGAGQSEASPWSTITPERGTIDWTSTPSPYDPGGLQLSGVGEGGGGIGHGIALGKLHFIPQARRDWGWNHYPGYACNLGPRRWQVPVMRMSWINVKGPVADQEVSRIVRAGSGAFNQCHQQEYKRNSAFRGITHVSFVLTPRGHVFSVALRHARSSDDFDLCVRTAALALRFPRSDAMASNGSRTRGHVFVPSGEIATVSFSLSFQMALSSHALGAGF